MRRSAKILIAMCLLAVVMTAGVFAIHHKRVEEKLAAAEKAALEAEQKEEQKRAEEQALLDRIKEERSQWYLLLVNSENAIPEDFSVETAEVESGYEVDARIRDAMAEMLTDCRAAGFSPVIISSFRTRETQQYLYDHTANKADTAIPGHSEHECGLAADIVDGDSLSWGDPLLEKQEEMPAQKWLMEHCRDYGFILRYPKDKQDITEIIYEPWHYRYVGKTHAAAIMDNGLCLEEYLADGQQLFATGD